MAKPKLKRRHFVWRVPQKITCWGIRASDATINGTQRREQAAPQVKR